MASSPADRRLWRTLVALALGQLISLCMAAASYASSALAKKGVDAPVMQSLLTYVLLAIVYGSVFLYNGQTLQVSWYWYILLGFLDVEGNYLAVKAYQYTSITSVTLLDCWTIAWVMILSWFVLKIKYTGWQFVGAGACIMGLVLVIFSDASSSASGAKNPFLGDVMVIAATLFFAFSNVGEEFCVKMKDRVEVVMMLGVFGSLISSIQLFIFEKEELQLLSWSYSVVSLFLLFGISLFAFYTFTPFLLKISGATLFNLSLLTSDLWAVIIQLFIYHESVASSYYVAYVIVAIGLYIYSFFEKQVDIPVAFNANEGECGSYTLLHNENEARST